MTEYTCQEPTSARDGLAWPRPPEWARGRGRPCYPTWAKKAHGLWLGAQACRGRCVCHREQGCGHAGAQALSRGPHITFLHQKTYWGRASHCLVLAGLGLTAFLVQRAALGVTQHTHPLIRPRTKSAWSSLLVTSVDAESETQRGSVAHRGCPARAGSSWALN